MAKMVTRTVKAYEVKALVFDAENESVKSETVFVEYHKDMDDKDIVKAAAKENGVQILKVQAVKVSEVLYGMTEETFLKYAEVMPPRAVKAETEEQ